MDPRLKDELAYAEQLADDDRAEATRRAYRNDLGALQRYLTERGRPTALPVDPLLISAFVGYQAGIDPATRSPRNRISTIERRLAGISAVHKDGGFGDPCADPRVRRALRGARRRLPSVPGKKQHLELEALDQILRRLPPTSHANRRDRALLLLGLAGALRRSELVAIDAVHIATVPEGIILTIPKSKTDQKSAGYKLAIARGDRANMCAVRALQAWMTAASIRSGAVFVRVHRGDQLTTKRLTDRSVALIVKKHCEAVGLDPELFAGHSLRSGGITAARRNGHDEEEISKLSRHRNMEILRGYIGRADEFDGVAQVLRSERR
jgi:integrase